MDTLFLDIIGKPTLNAPKIISVFAENFSFNEDQAKFLKATLAIPTIKQLPFDSSNIQLVQIGPFHVHVQDQVKKAQWSISQYEDFSESICDKLGQDLSNLKCRSIIFMNDLSRLQLVSNSPNEFNKFLRLVDRLKRQRGHFIVNLCQHSRSGHEDINSQLIEHISDAVVRVTSCKAGYFMAMWFQTIPVSRTLIPPKIETCYYTCKIGKSYWSQDLLCFFERRKVAKNYDLETDTYLDHNDDDSDEDDDEHDADKKLSSILGASVLHDDDERDSTLPFTQAQNPEKSRIFYYPDRDDDIDEDDPDNDLGI